MAAAVSLRGRLLRILLPATMVTLVLSGALMFHLVARQTWRELDRSLSLDAEDLASRIVIEGGEVVVDDEDWELPLPDHYALRDEQGKIFLIRGELELENRQPPLRSVEYSFRPRFEPTEEEEAQGVPARFGIMMDLQVGADPTAALTFLRYVFFALTGCGLVLLLVTTLVTWLGIRLGLRPLALFRQRIQRLDEHDLAWGTSPTPIPLELIPVEEELAHLIQRLHEAVERERRFIDAAAHELRTPLAELRTVSEVSLQLPHSPGATHALEQCREVGLEMEEMVELLLQLSRAPQILASSQGEASLQISLLTQINVFEEEILAKDLQIQVDSSRGCPWLLPASAAQLVARNLIANAVEYTQKGGHICIEWTAEDDGGTIQIKNGPVALQEQDLLRLTEPFWRHDPARNDRRHHGLGLSLVDAVARACQLKLAFELHGENLVVTLAGVI